jgi:hypothetical protein
VQIVLQHRFEADRLIKRRAKYLRPSLTVCDFKRLIMPFKDITRRGLSKIQSLLLKRSTKQVFKNLRGRVKEKTEGQKSFCNTAFSPYSTLFLAKMIGTRGPLIFMPLDAVPST